MADKCNEEFFSEKLAPILMAEISAMSALDGVSCDDAKAACDRVWSEYKALNMLSSVMYMKYTDELLDRHKVAACYLCACLKARPLKIDTGVSPEDVRWLANEAVALTVACAVLYGYLGSILDELESVLGEYDGLTEQMIDEARRSVSAGVDFGAFESGYGEYLESVLNCLFFTVAEENYNVLATALLVYHWEQSLFPPAMRSHIASFIRRRKESESTG